MAMMRIRQSHRVLALNAVAFLFIASCSSGDAETTVPPSTVAATSSTTSSSTTTTTAPPTPNGPAIAHEGDRNETVEALQFLINCNGYAQLTVDGAFGPASLAAVEAVQLDLGREVTGAPDDETLAILSRGCSEDRRVSIDDADDGEQIVVGNVAEGDPDLYFIRASEGERMSVVLETELGGAVVNVRSTDGGAVGTGGSAVWAVDIDSTSDYLVEISGLAPITYVATFALATLDPDDVDSADDGSIVVDGLDSKVSSSCLDTGGEGSYVAESALGHLVVTTGRVADFALDRGGVGAPLEFVFRDGSPGYYGFSIDLDVEVGDQIVGTGIVFLRGTGGADEPLGVAFDFDRAVTPCDGSSGTSIVLSADGLGIIEFGADAEATIDVVDSALVGASPSIDSDWVTIDNLSNEFGVCRAGTTEVRSVQFDNLTLFFTNAGTSFGAEGTRHFAGFTADDGVFPFKTNRAVGPGDTLEQVLAAHSDASAAAGLTGGIDVYISSPPGNDRWLRATADGASSVTDTGATVTSVTGGRFCDN
jgi:hypothetical protein